MTSRHAWLLTYGEGNHEQEELILRKQAFPDHTLIPASEFFEKVSPRDVPYDRNILIGDLRAMARILRLLHLPVPEQVYPPLYPHYGFNRRIERHPLPAFLASLPLVATETTPRFFVKPVQHKHRPPFAASILSEVPVEYLFCETTEEDIANGARTEEVHVQTYTPFLLEFRGFLVDGKFLEFRPYGRFYETMSPDHNRWFGFDHQGQALPFLSDAQAIRAVEEYYPKGAHVVDFGYISATGEPVIVEVNEPYAFGAYGCSPETLRAVLLAYWDTLVPHWRSLALTEGVPTSWSTFNFLKEMEDLP